MILKLSFVNAISAGSVAASSEDAEYPALNLIENGRPWKGWRSTGVGAQTVTATFGGSTVVGAIYLNNVNFANATITVGGFTVTPVIRFCSFCYRFQYAIGLDDVTASSMVVTIPGQTPVDGAAYFRIGGLWAGVAYKAPKHFLFNPERETVRPQSDKNLLVGGTTPVKKGNPYVRMTVERSVRTNHRAPGYQDDLESWAFLDYRLWQASQMLIVMSTIDSADGYIVTSVDQSFPWSRGSIMRSSSRITLTEMVGP